MAWRVGGLGGGAGVCCMVIWCVLQPHVSIEGARVPYKAWRRGLATHGTAGGGWGGRGAVGWHRCKGWAGCLPAVLFGIQDTVISSPPPVADMYACTKPALGGRRRCACTAPPALPTPSHPPSSPGTVAHQLACLHCCSLWPHGYAARMVMSPALAHPWGSRHLSRQCCSTAAQQQLPQAAQRHNSKPRTCRKAT